MNMKTPLLALTLLAAGSTSAFASMINVSCVNVDNTIRLPALRGPQVVEILVSKYDADNAPTGQLVTFEKSELMITESLVASVAAESGACTSTDYFTVKVTLARKDGQRMPDAYNRRADADGTLTEYFLCKRRTNATPGACRP